MRPFRYITLLALLGLNAETLLAQETGQKQVPRLVVSIAIDQLRTDYLEAFAPLYRPDGFLRLLGEGLVYQNASYPFSPLDRASAIAALQTGASPYYNGITGLRWFRRETLRPVFCVEDEQRQATADALLTSTVGDELKVATAGQAVVMAVAPSSDAAMLAAGHAADAAFWIDDESGEWLTAPYHTPQAPLWLASHNATSAPARKGKTLVWEPSELTHSSFSFFLQAEYPKPFKHKLTGNRRFSQYKASALVNADVTDMAQQCIAHGGMGNDGVTDLLSLTYYAGSFDHQNVTECQMELQDTYVRLDYELSRLIGAIERRLGRDQVLFVVTSTGYCDESDADYQRYRIPTGTFYMNRAAGLVDMYLGAIWGTGRYVEQAFGNQLYLSHKLLDQKRVSLADATSRAQEMLAMMQGVRNVYTSLQLLTSMNGQLTRVRNAFHPERCGDLIIEAAPGWRLLNEDTQESSVSRASYIPFPIIIYGAQAKAERIATPVTIDRIAPTIAKAIRIRAPNACSSEPLF